MKPPERQSAWSRPQSTRWPQTNGVAASRGAAGGHRVAKVHGVAGIFARPLCTNATTMPLKRRAPRAAVPEPARGPINAMSRAPSAQNKASPSGCTANASVDSRAVVLGLVFTLNTCRMHRRPSMS